MQKLSRKFYNDFPTKKFDREPRCFCYEISRQLIEKAHKSPGKRWYSSTNTVKGILLLLFTWNFAARITKQLKAQDIVNLLKSQADNLRSLEKYSIMDNWENNSIKISHIYKAFKKIAGQTGASKALSLLNPRLFVMWDTGIRRFVSGRSVDDNLRIIGIGNGESTGSYVNFLKGVKKIITTLGLHKKKGITQNNVAKKIDEYHFVKIIMKNAGKE